MAKEVGDMAVWILLWIAVWYILPAKWFAIGYGCVRLGRVVLSGIRRAFDG